MNDAERARRLLRLQVDVDTRLADVWGMAWHPDSVLSPVLEDDVQCEAFAAILRTAYVRGYRDALLEDSQGRREVLAIDNGYAGV